MNPKERRRWSEIGRMSWELAREAVEIERKAAKDAADHIWERVREYGLSEYERGILGKWACDNLKKIREEGK